jgi:hypothetical protein
VQNAPASQALTVKTQDAREHVQSIAHAAYGGWISPELFSPIAQERRSVEGWISNDRLWVDREPVACSALEDVARVEVLVQDDRLGRGPNEFTELSDRLTD